MKTVQILALRILPSAVGVYHEAVTDARKETRAACFRLDSITMHAEAENKLHKLQYGEDEKTRPRKLWKIRSVACVEFPARGHEGQTH